MTDVRPARRAATGVRAEGDHRRGRRALRVRALSLVAVALAALLIVAGATAELPGRNGRIAFMAWDAAKHWQVWIASASFGSQTQLTHANADSGWPVWSPDGSRIAFDSNRTDPNPNGSTSINDIFTMKADGSDVRKLTDSRGGSSDAAYSPDGALIAFDSDRGDPRHLQGVYVMDAADGSHLRRVTTLPAGDENDSAPRFSPDGQRLVFTRYKVVAGAELSALMLVNLDGTHLTRLTNWTQRVGDADWSPDGRRLVFETNYAQRGNHPADIYVIDASGKHLTNLTHNTGSTGSGASHRLEFSSDPVWSPDGGTILFLDGVVTGTATTGLSERAGLATMQPDGRQRRFILHDPTQELHQPDWESRT